MMDYREERLLDRLLRRETAFKNFRELLGARGNYRPSIEVSSFARYKLAELYDEAMTERGDDRRAYRFTNYAMAYEERQLDHGRALAYAEAHGLIRPTTAVELAKAFKAMSIDEMNRYKVDLRHKGCRDHLTHRGVEVLGLDADGERTEDIEYLDMKWISGKRFKQAAVDMLDNPAVKAIYFGGGLDQHEPFAEYMAAQREGGWSDYEPGVHYWGIEVPISLFN